MVDVGNIAAPVGFLGALVAMLTYIGKSIAADREKYAADLAGEQARTSRAEQRAADARAEADRALAGQRAADVDLATAEVELEAANARLRICRQEKRWAWQEIGRLRAYLPGDTDVLDDPPSEGEPRATQANAPTDAHPDPAGGPRARPGPVRGGGRRQQPPAAGAAGGGGL